MASGKPIAHATYLGGLRTYATHLPTGQGLLTDAPPDNHGQGQATSPTDLLATSLLTCLLTVLGIEAQKRSLNLAHASGRIAKTMTGPPRRVGALAVDLWLAIPNLPPDQRPALEEAVTHCPVTRSLHPDLALAVHYHWDQQPRAATA